MSNVPHKMNMVANAIGGMDDFEYMLEDAASNANVSMSETAAELSALSGIVVSLNNVRSWTTALGLKWKKAKKANREWNKLIEHFGSEEAMIDFVKPIALDKTISVMDFEDIMANRGVEITYATIRPLLRKSIGVPWNGSGSGGGSGWRYPDGMRELVSILFSAAFDVSGYTYRELAAELGVSRELVRCWIDGRTMPHLEAVNAIASKCARRSIDLQEDAKAIEDAARALRSSVSLPYTKRRERSARNEGQ